jgi:hypothetical protein
MRARQSLGRGFPVTIERLEDRRLLSAMSSTALAASVIPAVFGQNITLTATVTSKSGNPSGTVTFKDGSAVLGTAAVNATTHHATFATSKLSVATHNLIAVYGSTSAFTGSTSATLKEKINADATKTTLAASTLSPVLGQSVTLTATVAAAAPGSGMPKGTVQFKQGSTILGSATLDSSGHTSLKIYTLYLGSHAITAAYTGGTAFKASTSSAVSVVVKQATLTTLADGLKRATIAAGSGPGAVAYQSIEVDYTGYLNNGTKFDSSLNAGRTPFDFQLGVGQVIAGWDEGLVGAKVGETRVLVIPPALGYGSQANGSIPANSTLTFIIKVLKFITAPKLVVVGKSNTLIANNAAPSTAAGTNFGSVKVSASSATLTLLIANTGNAPLQPTANPPVLISGTNAGDFVVTQPLVQNGQILFTITFKPKATGTRTAKITIRTNDPTTPNFTFTVSGIGT